MISYAIPEATSFLFYLLSSAFVNLNKLEGLFTLRTFFCLTLRRWLVGVCLEGRHFFPWDTRTDFLMLI